MLVLQENQPTHQVKPPSLLQSQHSAAPSRASPPSHGVFLSLAGANVFNVSLGWKKSRSNGLQQVPVWEPQSHIILFCVTIVIFFTLLLFQLVDILSMGFQNKFYNASMKDPAGSSDEGVSEYRINVSSDTPHWYIRDYMARVSGHYDISAVEVDGGYNFEE